MNLLSRNIVLGKPVHLSAWRKIAIGTWNRGGDPSVYGMMEVDIQPLTQHIEELSSASGKRITLTHALGRVFGEVLRRHPEINMVLRFGKLYPRKTIDIFFQ